MTLLHKLVKQACYALERGNATSVMTLASSLPTPRRVIKIKPALCSDVGFVTLFNGFISILASVSQDKKLPHGCPVLTQDGVQS